MGTSPSLARPLYRTRRVRPARAGGGGRGGRAVIGDVDGTHGWQCPGVLRLSGGAKTHTSAGPDQGPEVPPHYGPAVAEAWQPQKVHDSAAAAGTVQVATTSRAKAGRHPVAGRGGGGGGRRPWARPRTSDSDHHRPGPGRRATAGQRAGSQAIPSGPRSGRQSGLTRGSRLPRPNEGGSPAD